MNDGYDPGHGDDQYELVGYDEYGRPVYRQAQGQEQGYAQPGHQQQYDPYAQQHGQQEQQYGQQGQQQYGQQGYGYDPYATGTQQAFQQPYDPYGSQGGYDTGQQPAQPPAPDYGGHGGRPAGPQPPYDPYGRAATSGPQARVAEQTAHIPQQAGPPEQRERTDHAEEAGPGGDYRTEQFAFVEEPTGDSEDVIDWMKFTENRTERREEARRRARSRVVALVVVLALVAVGGVGYLWYAGKLPGLSSSDDKTGDTATAGAQKRDVIAVHLHDTKGGGTSTALLVNNTTTKQDHHRPPARPGTAQLGEPRRPDQLLLVGPRRGCPRLAPAGAQRRHAAGTGDRRRRLSRRPGRGRCARDPDFTFRQVAG
ncbi:LytR family transcriptional regulator OS=Streptomyces tendae OX=1932 GN=GUR47_09510 PE=3 SV=1 [Streptomyces tendae]